MTTYYVRKTGLDSNDGLSKGAALLTIDKAAADKVAAGDTVYVGAGVYRETVTMVTAGTSGNLISFIADVDGSNTDDPGLVIISAYANELSTASRLACLDMDTKEFITWQGFVMTGGTEAVITDQQDAGNRAYEEVTFEDCVLLSGHSSSPQGVLLDLNEGATPTTAGLSWRRCIFNGGALEIRYDENATAEVDCKMVIDSCVFLGHPRTFNTASGFWWRQINSSSFHVGGVAVSNCLFSGMVQGLIVDDVTPASPSNVVDARNCVFQYVAGGLVKFTSNDGLLTSDYNTFLGVFIAHTNVTAGGNDRATNTDPGLWGGVGDYPLYRFLGWSPYRPWEPIRLQDDAYIHGVIGDANTSDAPAFDLYNENRPMYGTVDDRGAVEGRARPEQETTTTRTGSNAIRFEGAGWHDFIIPVSNQSTTVSIYGQFDSNYTGSKPILEVLNIDGVADQSDIMTGSADAFEELTATFTPTGDGVCRVRIRSQDTSATGEAFFDDLTVT